MNHNSLKAYREIIADGTLTESEATVYTLILKHGPINNRQIDDLTNGQGHKRTRALLESGAIYGVDKLDPVTNKTSSYYSVTGEKPIKPKVIRKNRHALDLSGLYDHAYRYGAVDTIRKFFPLDTEDEIAEKVDAICEAQNG